MTHRKHDLRAAVASRQRSQEHLRATTTTIGLASLLTAGGVALILPGATHHTAARPVANVARPASPADLSSAPASTAPASPAASSAAPSPHHHHAAAPVAASGSGAGSGGGSSPAAAPTTAPAPAPTQAYSPPQTTSGGS